MRREDRRVVLPDLELLERVPLRVARVVERDWWPFAERACVLFEDPLDATAAADGLAAPLPSPNSRSIMRLLPSRPLLRRRLDVPLLRTAPDT